VQLPGEDQLDAAKRESIMRVRQINMDKQRCSLWSNIMTIGAPLLALPTVCFHDVSLLAACVSVLPWFHVD
jgi:hypothetical protein